MLEEIPKLYYNIELDDNIKFSIENNILRKKINEIIIKMNELEWSIYRTNGK